MSEHISHYFKLSPPGERHCPHCKRVLVDVHEDGSFDLSYKTAIEGTSSVTWNADDEIEEQETTFEVTCLRTKCRIKAIVANAIRE